jgi:hypothetical protein
MATWIRLTTSGSKGASIMVNMDQVTFMQGLEDSTILHFVSGRADSDVTWTVSETMDEIEEQGLR